MKRNLPLAARDPCLGLLISAVAVRATADDSGANLKTASGTVSAVDATNKVLKLRGWLFPKTFVLGNNCQVSLVTHTAGSLAEFQPGAQVDVTYRSVQGVLVASEVAEKRLALTGKVAALDRASGTIVVAAAGKARAFKLPDNCEVILNGGKKGVPADLELGGRVTILYETPEGHWTAARIEQPSQHFTGTLGEIDTVRRTLTAGKKLIGDRQFHIAGDCAVVLGGKTDGRLLDLKAGQIYELSYTTVEGVNIVNRIAPATELANPALDLTRNVPVY